MLNQQVHYFIGAGPYLCQTDISYDFFDGIYLCVTDAAHDLHGLIGNFPGRVGGKFLGFTDEPPGVGCPGVHGAGGHINDGPGGVQLCNGVRHHEIDALVLTNGFSKSHALIAVTQCKIKSCPDPQTCRSRGQAFWNHHLVEDQGTGVHIADQILFGYADISKNETSGTAAPGTHETVLVFGFHPRPPFDQQGTDPFMLVGILVKVGPAVNQKNIGLGSTHYKTFLAIDDEMIIFEGRCCCGTKKV